ncbi:uncharacterized protein [Clytia hemisphaerica]
MVQNEYFGKKPKTVKVTVYSSRNLRPKKGDGDPLAWVVFGFGKEKCCTSQIRDRNAKWNEESTFTLTDTKSPLKINVKDKEDPLGQIIIPLSEIPSDEHFLKWVQLGPHKKNQNPHGEICLDCWIEDYYEEGDEDNSPNAQSGKTGKFFRKNLNRLAGRSPEANRKKLSPHNDRRESNSLGMTSIKGSVSVEDLTSRSNGKTSPNFSKKSFSKKDSLLAPAAYTNIRKSVSTLALSTPSSPKSPSPESTSPTSLTIRRNSFNEVVASPNPSATNNSLPTIKEQCYPPKVLSIVPTSGPADGGTLIQITGKYLGNSKDDITRLMVAGCNCLSSIEYYSSSKIMCTTTESLGTGPITLSTRSGGMSSSKVMFEFLEQKMEKQNETNNNTDSGRSSGASASDESRDKDELIENLKNEVEGLRHDNQELREYIDKLVVYLMDKYPGALESSKMYR